MSRDLSDEDCRRLALHLDACVDCRRHRAALKEVRLLLAAAADDFPVAPGAPSLWPALERRILVQQAHSPARWRRVLRGLCPPRITAAADRLYHHCGLIRSELPLQLAWAFDTSRQALDNLLKRPGGRSRAESGGVRFTRNPVPIMALSLTCALLAILAAVPSLQRRQAQAQARIAANAAPIAILAVPLAQPRDRDDALPGFTSGESSTSPRSSDSMTHSEPPPSLELAGAASSPSDKSSRTATASPRYDFDLEHGTPMPPDARQSKTAY